jgi:hypothetical protein
LVEVPPSIQDGKIFVKNARWASPHESDAKKRMRKFFESPDRPLTWSNDLKEIIRKEFSLKSICVRYEQILKELE